MLWQGENGALPDTNKGERMRENGKEDVYKKKEECARGGKKMYTPDNKEEVTNKIAFPTSRNHLLQLQLQLNEKIRLFLFLNKRRINFAPVF